jgi:hypothetical protein
MRLALDEGSLALFGLLLEPLELESPLGDRLLLGRQPAASAFDIGEGDLGGLRELDLGLALRQCSLALIETGHSLDDRPLASLQVGLPSGEGSLPILDVARPLGDERVPAVQLRFALRDLHLALVERTLAFVQPARSHEQSALGPVELDLERGQNALPLVELGSAAIRLGADMRCRRAGSRRLRRLGVRALRRGVDVEPHDRRAIRRVAA